MSTDAVERDVQRTAAKWAFVQRVETVDKTDDAIKLRLHIDTDCFVQVYVNTRRDWLRVTGVNPQPQNSQPATGHGRRRRWPRCVSTTSHLKASAPLSLDDFLKESQQVLQDAALL